MRNHGELFMESSRGIKQEESRRRQILEEEASKSNPGRGVLEREPNKNNPGAGMRKKTWSKIRKRGIMF